MPTQAKIDRVAELREKLENCSIVISTGCSGIGVNQMVNLRRRMREGGVEFIVIKNNLLNLAADGANVPQLKDVIAGQTAIALGYDDAAAIAKAVADAANADGTLRIHGAVVAGGPAMDTAEVTRLASLPPQPVLVAQLLGNMQGPLYGLATVLNGTIAALAYALQARVDQMQPEDAQPEDAQPEDAQPEDAQPEDAQPEDAQPEDEQAEDVQAEDAQAEDAQPEDAQAEDVQAEDVQAEDAQAEDAQPEDAQAEDVQAEDVQAEDAQAEDAQPEEVQPEAVAADE